MTLPQLFQVLCLTAFALLSGCEGGPASPTTPTAEAVGPLDEAAIAPLREAFQGTEQVRAALSGDNLAGVAPAAAPVAAALERARPLTAPPFEGRIGEAASAAHRLADAPDIAAARVAFAQLNEALFDLAASDARLQDGWTTFRCPMTDGFQKWFQSDDELRNPYFGSAMLTCGQRSDWGEARLTAAVDDAEVAFYTCPMHPAVRQATPGACPLCGMDLVAVTQEEARRGVVRIDEARRQEFGVRVEPLASAPLTRSIRANGRVTVDETQEQEVTLLVGGQVRSLRVEQTGQAVRRGEVLLTLYSPELVAGQEELLASRGANEALARATRDRLRRWGMTDAQLAQVESTGDVIEEVPFFVTASGRVLEKRVVEGATIAPGQLLMRVAPLDRVWVLADIYERDVPWVEVGQRVRVSSPYDPGVAAMGTVTFLHPTLDPTTRTRAARVVLDEAAPGLLPEMFVDVTVRADAGEALVVPEEAVVYLGERRVVFVDEGQDRIAPRVVTLGRRADQGFELRSGLVAGDRVVVSGNFLVAAESRIRSSSSTWGEGDHAHQH